MHAFVSEEELFDIHERGGHSDATAVDALGLAWYLPQRDGNRAIALAHRWATDPSLTDDLRGVVHLGIGEHALLRDDAAGAAKAIALERAVFVAGGSAAGLSDASVLESAALRACSERRFQIRCDLCMQATTAATKTMMTVATFSANGSGSRERLSS